MRSPQLRTRALSAFPAAGVLCCCLLMVTYAAGTQGHRPARTAQRRGKGRETEKPLVFLSVGDWGQHGSADQRRVAEQLIKAARRHEASFILGLGDNVYDAGVRYVDDPALTEFEDVYPAAELPIPWYMSLGDHDHRGSVLAQVEYTNRSTRWKMPAPYYTAQVGGGGSTTIKLVVTDSVGLEGYAAGREVHTRRFESDLDPVHTNSTAGLRQLKWLREAMKPDESDWVVVVGHRPVRTAGMRDRTPAELRTAELLTGEFHKAGVPLYMCGHDHTEQLLFDGVTHYIVNGGGGYGSLHGVKKSNRWLQWGQSAHGFTVHTVRSATMKVEWYDEYGELLHSTLIRNPLHTVEHG
eukprot:Hpha_TRINITY_DN17405_c0_g1::TRINITY_DN17405_c0_g1_i1::g.85897::m.85897/K14379/ACP5; tartrate-resistant acid phosphatase type 5